MTSFHLVLNALLGVFAFSLVAFDPTNPYWLRLASAVFVLIGLTGLLLALRARLATRFRPYLEKTP